MNPWHLAQAIVKNSTSKGRNSVLVANWRQELNDLVGNEEARRLIEQARENSK